MKRYQSKVALAFTLYLLELCITHNKTIASTLFIGPNGSFVKDINSINFYQNKELDDLKRSDTNKKNIAKSDNTNSIEQKTSEEKKDLIEDIDADKINEDIKDRYLGLVEDEEQLSLIESNQLTENILENEALSEANLDILQENSETVKSIIASDEDTKDELLENSSKGILLGIILGGSAIAFLTINSLKSSEDNGIFGFIFNKFGKPQIPDKAIDLHSKTFKKLSTLGVKVEKLDDEKFQNREFIKYLQLEKEIKQGDKKRNSLSLSLEYLKVGILAQSSFLKLESTELRYRSIKQQSFYSFVAENITDNVDKDAFRLKVKEKLAEIKPLVNSEEGKIALQSYFDEINKISRYDLGLKLLSLFKKYQLTDFTILRRVSDIAEQASAENLSKDDNLKLLVLENYDTFEKLAPIIQMDEENITPQVFTKILQYLGLGRRYEKAFQEFQNLIKVIIKWEKPYNSLIVIRQQYSDSEYSLPKEFYQEIPGLKIYKKYQEYIEKNR